MNFEKHDQSYPFDKISGMMGELLGSFKDSLGTKEKSKTFLETLNEMNEEGYPEEALFLMFKKREAILSQDFELGAEISKEIESLLPKFFPFNPDWDVTDCRPDSNDLKDWKEHVFELEDLVLLLQDKVEYLQDSADHKDAIIEDWEGSVNFGEEIEKPFVGDSDHEKE